VARLAIEPRPETNKKYLYQNHVETFRGSNIMIVVLMNCTINKFYSSTYRLTSSADCAMKKPTVFDGSFVPLGLMEILLSFPSSVFTSIANSNNLSFTKHSLEVKLDTFITFMVLSCSMLFPLYLEVKSIYTLNTLK
jgi:hypothetical protein